ncbi:MAG TPA: PqqD family protein [Pyrinomonadaceae bacterium]|nr:PqqD family protein [Pyrinomonadaceae bacterium]
MNNAQNPIARDNGLVVQEMDNEVLVYDLDSNKAHCLNDSAAFVWRSCDGTNSVADIVKEFEKNSKGKVSEDFVWLAIDQLNENGLLTSGVTKPFAGQSRREVLKKIGLASLVALPVVASLVTPQSAMAAGSCACPAGNPAPCAALTPCPNTANCNPGGVCAP